MGSKLSAVYPDVFEDSAFGDLEVEGVLGEWERIGGHYTLRLSNSEPDGLEILVTRGDTLVGRYSELFPALEEVRRRSPSGYTKLADWPPLENPDGIRTPLGELRPIIGAQYGRGWLGTVRGVHLRLHELRGGWALEANNLIWEGKMVVARPFLEDVYDHFRNELEEAWKSVQRVGGLLEVWERPTPVEGRPWWERLSQ